MHPFHSSVGLVQPARALAQALIAAALAALLLLAMAPRVQAQAPLPAATTVTKMTPMKLAAKFDRTCAQWRISGICPTWPRVRLRVTMWVPVAYVETTRTPGETTVVAPALLNLLAKPTGYGSSIGQSRSLVDNTSEAHVYTIPERLVLSAGLGPINMVCTPSDAALIDRRGPAETASLLTRATCSNAMSYVAGEMTKAVLGAFDGFASEALCTPKPVYLSEVDLPNWRTGCGDESIAKLMESNGITCATQTAADFMALGSGFGSIIGMDSCIGSWGPLFPRQMRERGLNPIAASAKTAYRAMSLARTSFGTMAFPLGIEGKMQQVYPTVSQCFHPGEPLPQVTGKPAMLSPNGVYGWVYWRPVTCCVPKGGAGGCFL